MTLLYNMYKPIIIHSGLLSELRYMSNGLNFKMRNGISWNFQEIDKIIMVTKCRDNRLKIDWLDNKNLTFILDHPLLSDRL